LAQSSDRTDRLRAALRRRPIYFAVSTAVLIGGVAVLTAAGAPEWLVIAFLIVLWAALMYVLRWRGQR
jgi:hypothetical protein